MSEDEITDPVQRLWHIAFDAIEILDDLPGKQQAKIPAKLLSALRDLQGELCAFADENNEANYPSARKPIKPSDN
jgi:hypothetical protein